MKFSSKGELFGGLTKENILKLTTEAEIYKHYIGDFYVNGVISAPYRKDRNPSFGIFQSKGGQLMWKDLARGDSGDVFKLLELLLNSSFFEVLQDVDRSMNLGLSFQPTGEKIQYQLYKNYENLPKETCLLQRIIQPYTYADKQYWSNGHVSKKTLEYLEILSTFKLFYNRQLMWKYSDNNPIYSWQLENKLKAYRPLESNQKRKWITNYTQEIQGLNKIPAKGDILIVTKSMKDIAVYYEIGIPAIAPQSEHIIISEEIIQDLSNRYNTIITNFDNDEAGINLSNQYKELYGLDSFMLKNYKDPFEFSVYKGLSEFEKEINKFLK
jgi:hypothetical protein